MNRMINENAILSQTMSAEVAVETGFAALARFGAALFELVEYLFHRCPKAAETGESLARTRTVRPIRARPAKKRRRCFHFVPPKGRGYHWSQRWMPDERQGRSATQ